MRGSEPTAAKPWHASSIVSMGVLLAIVQAGHKGLLFREVGERTGIPASTLSHHLRFLTAAQLITQEKRGRETISRPNFEKLEALSGFILATCCAAVPDRQEEAT
ncbi:MAG: helix-turn-helix domain-containing protein [Pseudomonadota bacterium]